MRSTSLRWSLLSLASLIAACALGANDGGPHPLPGFDDGKDDNYVSSTAREFVLSGEAHLALPDGFYELSDEDAAAALDELVARRLNVVSRSIRDHIDRVIREANGGVSGSDATYFTYFKRNHAEAEPAVALDDGRARFGFEIELVGSLTLMSKVAPGTSSRRRFEVVVADWGEPDGERVWVTIRGSDSRDAFPRYDALFADGVLDIAMHFGGDYNADRHDLETARWTVEYLLEGGFSNPEVASFEDLHLSSPPFTRELLVEGQALEVQVYVYHSEMAAPPEQHLLADAMRESFATRDIVLYSGHAGPGAGFVLDYHPRYELPAREFAELPLADKPQIYVFDGCQTYRTYVDDLMKNPRKTFETLDIVTTVNNTPFGVGYQVIHQLLYWLTITDAAGNHYPLTWMELLRGINRLDMARGVYYGVHGVDENPKLNPHASEGIACSPCGSDADCGAGGNLCLGYAGGAACGVACSTDTACGPGYRCARLTSDPDLFYIPKQCVRRDYVCP
jgi:hypothetical protein